MYEQGQEETCNLFLVCLSSYAQEFVETLERTVDADEVLFVCAFAIYQNEVQSMSAKQDNVDNFVCVDIIAAGRRRSNGLSTNWGLYE